MQTPVSQSFPSHRRLSWPPPAADTTPPRCPKPPPSTVVESARFLDAVGSRRSREAIPHPLLPNVPSPLCIGRGSSCSPCSAPLRLNIIKQIQKNDFEEVCD